jgi:hypothetical protein
MGKTFIEIATEIAKLVEQKDAAYGNSFDLCGDFLKLLYPKGVLPEQYSDMLCIVRIFDKMKRIATNRGAFSENPYQDIVGYGLLGTRKYENESEEKASLENINKVLTSRQLEKKICGIIGTETEDRDE